MGKDWLLVDRVALAAFITLVALATYGYVILPASIPTSFSLNGAPQAYSSKLELFLAPAFAALAIVATAFATTRPMRVNVPFNIPPERMGVVQPIAVMLIRAIRLVLILGFTLIEWSTLESARLGRLDTAFPVAIIGMVVALFATTGFFTVRMWRAARG